MVLVRAILGVVIHYSRFVHNMLCAGLLLSRRIISLKSKQFTMVRLMSGNVVNCWDKSLILLKSGNFALSDRSHLYMRVAKWVANESNNNKKY